MLATFLATNGIFHLITPSHTPEHNGYSRHRHHHCHIVEMGLSLFSHAFIPLSYCPYAFVIVAYLISHMLTPTLHLSLHMQNSLDLNQTIPSFVLLVVCVILGFVHSLHAN